MNSINRRGRSATRTRPARHRRIRARFGIGVAAALALSLSCAVSALAASGGPGVSGPGFVTTPDSAPLGYAAPDGYTASQNGGLGVPAGSIKHVWVIVMENHAYESNFTGLNNNDYLSHVLPQYGAELTHYYGTGHSSLDNYLSMVSGQAPITDDQDDCGADGYTALAGATGSNYTGGIDTAGGSLASNGDYGQFASAAGPNAPAGDNGCVYPSSVPTLFNQLDAAGKSWKVYAQDMANTTSAAGQNAGVSACGAPDSSVGPVPSSSQPSNLKSAYPNDSSANANDQYVSKHNPLPWFESMLNSGECDSAHLGNLMDGSGDTLYNDLQAASSTPDLSYIVPDNCSNGHDAVCAGNNLSGMAADAPTDASEGTPINNVGGAYSSDLFLEHVIPEIMQSPAYTAGGLIAVVWDEAYPQFTYSSDSFVDSTTTSATAANSLQNDAAGETLFGKSLNWEPSGPNVPDVQSAVGQQMAGGPGYNEYLDRPGSAATAPLVGCSAGTPLGNGYATVTTGGCYTAGGSAGDTYNNVTGTVTVSGSTGGSITTPANGSYYNLIAPDDEGETVTLGGGVTGSDIDGDSGSTGPFYVGQVTSNLPAASTTTSTDTTSADQYGTASFQLVDADGNPVTLGGSTGSFPITLGAHTAATDPLYDAFDPANGGGDSGALLLSPYIKGGTVSNVYYNHYSLLRSIEDMFDVSGGSGSATGYTGPVNVSTGVDGNGHLGYAAQPGLDPFGTDVFSNSPFDTTTDTTTDTVTNTVTTPGPTVTATNTVTTPGATVTQTGTVTNQGPTSTDSFFDVLPGTTVTHTTTITHTTTVAGVECVVPDVVGDSLTEARQLLIAAQCALGSVKGPKAKHGYTQVVNAASPTVGTTKKRGTKVTLTVALSKR